MKPKVFVALSTFAEHDDLPLRLLEEAGVDVVRHTLGRRLDAGELVALGQEAVAVVAGVEPYTEQVLSAMPSLRCISRCGVGIDNIALEAAASRGIAIRNTPDVVTAPVAEFTLALTLDLLKKLTYHTRLLNQRTWRKSMGDMLAGREIGIVGLGRIGRRVAELMRALGASVSGCDVEPDRGWAHHAGVELLTLEDLLERVDVLCLHVAARSDAPFRLDARLLARMRPGAYIVNVSRGEFIDEEALHAALAAGALAGAALDVFSTEPYLGPLADLENVILTPHIATLTRQSRAAMEAEAARNVLSWLGESKSRFD
jgi:D-3-phosphoglycerate dehydrogenase